MPQTPWQPIGCTAAVQIGRLSAVVNLTQPRNGLADVMVAGHRLAAARLLGVAAAQITDAEPARPADNYVRGTDLVVAYEEPGQQPIHVDAVWRAIAPAPDDEYLAAIDLIVSVRTGSLDSRPQLTVQSAVPSHEVLRLAGSSPADWTALPPMTNASLSLAPAEGTGCLLFRMRELNLSYVEMVHPVDFQRDEFSRDESGGAAVVHITHRLFRTSLEKGVILRGRVRGVFLDRDNDSDAAARCYADFAAAEPPLDT